MICAATINLPLLITESWISSSGIFAFILILILLFASCMLTYGYLKFARARGFLASGLIFLIMALSFFNIAGILATWPLSFRALGSGAIIGETVVFYLMWLFASIAIWKQKECFYCLNCKVWSDETYASETLEGISDIEELKKQLADDNVGILADLKNCSAEEKAYSKIMIRRCSKCGDAYLFVLAVTKRPFRGPIRELKYILRDPTLGGTVAGTVVELEDVVIKGQLLSKENFDLLEKKLSQC